MHEPVLLDEVLEYLEVRRGGVYVDGTLGSGGHAEALLRQIGPDGLLVGIDQDAEAIARSEARLAGQGGNYRLFHASYADLEALLREAGVAGIDGLLLDLGVSSEQLDAAGRGFSFQKDGPLDMRMDRSAGSRAADLIAELPETELSALILNYGEERHARRIARAIVRARATAPINTTAKLGELVSRASGGRRGRIHPATRTFQALRIAVNDELTALRTGLAAAARVLAPRGRLAVIAFHSLEDRIVKRFFKPPATARRDPRGAPRAWRILTPKPVTASEQERRRNPRARSAKLRVAERIEETQEGAG